MRVFLGLVGVALLATAADLPRRAWLGAAFGPAEGGGVAIVTTLPGGPAEAAGLKAGDTVLSLDDVKLDAPMAAVTFVRGKVAGSVVRARVRRGGNDLDATIKVMPLPLEKSEGIDIDYGALPVRGALRRTIVTRPPQTSKAPAVLLVGGVGCYPADNPLAPFPYTDILHRLTRAGFVTLRVEKSGMGDSQGTPCNEVDFETELDGYREGLKMLAKLPYVDASSLYIFGHSMGGVAGPVLAKEFPLKAIAVMATVGDSWFEYELSNIRRQRTLRGGTEAEIDAAVAQRRDCVYAMLIQGKEPPENCKEVQYPASLAYMRQVAAVKLGETWQATTIPVLVMWGTLDFVSGEPDHKYLVARLNRMKAGRATYLPIEDMDHFFDRGAEGKGRNLDWVPQLITWFGSV